MMRAVISAALLLMLGAASVPELNAQLLEGPAPGSELGTVSLKFGLVAPQTTFTDDSFGESGFDNGFSYGINIATWPVLGHRIGIRGQIMRSETKGTNSTSEFAPIAMNDPTIYFYTLELAARQPVEIGEMTAIPFVAGGYGGKHYTWEVSQHKSSRFATFTVATGVEVRPTSLGAFGIIAEARAYRSNFRAFGIDDGSWEPGFYGGNVGGVKNLDLLFSTGVSLNF